MIAGLVFLFICAVSACAEKPAIPGEDNLAEHSLTLDDVVSAFSDHHGTFNGFNGLWIPYDEDNTPEFFLYDVTGDGCVDLCTCMMVGSGMVRVILIVYDPVNDKEYILDGYQYSYKIGGVEDDRLFVIEIGPYGYGDPIIEADGTVVLEDDQLVFVHDPVNDI